MAGSGLPHLGLTTQFSAAIVQFPASDGALLRSGLDSARLYFNQRAAYFPPDIIHTNDSREWRKTSGYYAEPHLWQETYDYRPGLTPLEPGNSMEFPPPADKAGLHIRDFHGRWILVDGDLGPQEAVVFPGLALHQATAGYVNPALHKTEISNMQDNIYGRCSLAFKIMPKSMTNLSCSEMRAPGHGVEAQFQLPVPVDDFMQRSHLIDQIFNRPSLQCFNFPTAQDRSMKPLMRRKKQN
ncbi:2-oxoglutarate (2OG) and Fe(II)-dependent oxygenase superfamily protein [Quillaja saponaria]|uniref:2-oxoglutarate (2OG) and Fe(II)-dependent oxygenase superfamily protein n=1 Tax=Quillaja saponaria TaxID=32244 RepID=A0AAD7QI93_QUISA|nr:2-oxoglutarate (2OG) and Fe(II)-dependent oxygenase superfamily protein [Quillaja saponaria]